MVSSHLMEDSGLVGRQATVNSLLVDMDSQDIRDSSRVDTGSNQADTVVANPGTPVRQDSNQADIQDSSKEGILDNRVAIRDNLVDTLVQVSVEQG